jgi:hypothetical protein
MLIVPGPFFINIKVTKDGAISELIARTKITYF